MANQIQATVYQIDGNPLIAPLTVSFLTSDILIRENTISTILEVASSITIYPNSSNLLQEQTFFVSESISTLLTAANTNGTTLIQATILEINGDPQVPSGVQYCFPANAGSIWASVNAITGVNSFLTFKNKNYSASETETTLVAAANAGGGGGGGGLLTADNGLTAIGTNVQLGGTLLADTSINAASNSFDVSNGQIIGINAGTINLYAPNTNGITIRNNEIILGDFNDIINLTTFFIDDQNKHIYSKLEGISKGLSLDVVGANDLYWLGKLDLGGEFQGLYFDYANNTLQLGLLASPERPHLQINNSTLDLALTSGAAGININYSLGLTNIGDVNSYGNATNIQIFDQSAVIQTIFASAANGLYLNLSNGSYYFGDYMGIITSAYLHIDATSGTSTLISNIITLSGGGGSGFFMDLALAQTIIGDYANVGNNSFLKVDDSEGKISLNTANGLVNITNMPSYADNAAALAAGLVVGDLYIANGLGFDDFLHIVH